MSMTANPNATEVKRAMTSFMVHSNADSYQPLTFNVRGHEFGINVKRLHIDVESDDKFWCDASVYCEELSFDFDLGEFASESLYNLTEQILPVAFAVAFMQVNTVDGFSGIIV